MFDIHQLYSVSTGGPIPYLESMAFEIEFFRLSNSSDLLEWMCSVLSGYWFRRFQITIREYVLGKDPSDSSHLYASFEVREGMNFATNFQIIAAECWKACVQLPMQLPAATSDSE